MSEYDNNKNGKDNGQSGYEDVCFICHRPESKAGRMFKLPNNICVCDDCMHKTMDSMSQYNFQGMMPPFFDYSSMMNGASNGKQPPEEEKHLTEEEDAGTEVVSEGEDSPDKTEKKDRNKGKKAVNQGFPNISFINLSDLQNMRRRAQQAEDQKEKGGRSFKAHYRYQGYSGAPQDQSTVG